MLAGVDGLLSVVASVYGSAAPPRPFCILRGMRQLQQGDEAKEVAKRLGTTSKRLSDLARSGDPLRDLFKATLEEATDEAGLAKRRQSLGQMLLGDLAERAFERLYEATLGADELHLEDARTSRSETDYRVLNGSRRPVFRLNIKFHGTPFKNAKDLVALEPEDCFALATYKIWQGVQKQETERLPYVFAIVGVPGLTGATVGSVFPSTLAHLSAFVYRSDVSGKRDVEDAIVRHLIEHEQPDEVRRAVADFAGRIERAEWRVISARRADRLLRQMLFERVYAVRVRAFAQNYRRAEVDMHFSISRDLTPLIAFLSLRKEHGLHGLAVRLEAGDV